MFVNKGKKNFSINNYITHTTAVFCRNRSAQRNKGGKKKGGGRENDKEDNRDEEPTKKN